jgi:hypothetical protein
MSDIADLVKSTGQPEAPDPGIGDLVAGPASPEENNAGTRVANPGTEAFASGVLEGGGAAAGIYAGARLGQIGGGYGMAAGAVLGAVVGSEAGQGAREALGLRTPQQMAPDQRSLAEFTYSLGGGAAAAATPFGAAAVGLQLLEQGSRVGRWLMGAVRQAQRRLALTVAAEIPAVVAAAGGASVAEMLDPGDALTRGLTEFGAGAAATLTSPISAWNGANRLFGWAMGKYGRNATEVKFGQQLVAAIKEAGDDPEQVLRVLEAGNPYGLSAAQLTADPVMMATERALAKKSDVFARSVHEKGFKAREAMTAQINILKLDGNPENLATIAALRKAQFDTIMEERVQIATAKAKDIVARGVRKGLSDEALGDISARARGALDEELDRAEDFVGELYSKVSLNVPVRMDRTQQVIDEILSRSADELKGQKIPTYLMNTVKKAQGKATTTYDPETFVISEVPAGPATSDSRNLIDIRRQLLSDARAAEIDPSKAMQAGLNKKLQAAVMDDLDVAFKEGLDDSYDAARAANRAMNDVFERSFAGKSTALGKRGELIDPREMLKRAFATGGEAASLRLKDLEEATRFMVTRGMGDEGATDVMLKAQEEALRLISTASMKDGRINPATMVEYIRKNGALFNREPFISVRDDLMEAVKSEQSLGRLEDFVKRRQNDIGKNSAFARISGSNPVDYASRILVSSGDQESQFVKMFNMAKKGGTNRQGVQTVTPEQGVSSARASVLNAAFERSKQGSVFNLDTFRELLFVPRVSGQKSPITIMREQGVMTPEHVSNLSKLFNSLETLKIAERQGFGMDPKQSVGEIVTVLGAKVTASKGVSWLQNKFGQSGSSIVIAGAVTKAAETIVSKIPAAKVQDVAVLLMNDPKALAAVMRKETTAQGRMLQVQRFHSWLIQTGVTANRDFGPVEMFSQQESTP